MPRRVRDPSSDQRDWITRAAEAREVADAMADGPLRDDALRKAAQLHSAGELLDSLKFGEAKPPTAGVLPRRGTS